MAVTNETGKSTGAETAGQEQRGQLRLPRSDFLAGFNRLDLLRQLGLMIGLAASIAIGFAVVLWSRGESYQPLYGDMQGYDVTELMAVLEAEQIAYRVDPTSGVILVPTANINALRLQVAAAGITRNNGYGYETLDQEQGLGTSQFMETNRYKRSQEGELQRTISGFRNVQSARVHLATPERSVFVRNSRKPTASVFLTVLPGRELADMQVLAIANLVASSVPELSPDDVTIVDQQGNLLSRQDSNSELAIAGQQFDYVRRYEDTLLNRINRILQPVVGGRFTAEVAADIDFTRTEQAAETWNPEGAVLRSEQSVAERAGANELAAGVPGTLNTQAPVGGAIAAEVAPDTVQNPVQNPGVTANIREQATRNYELDRTVSYTNYDPISVRRLSVAVVLDDQLGPDGEASQPWNEDEIQRITQLVRDVIGFDESRGDRVTVMNRRFAPVPELAAEVAIPIWQQAWLLSAAKQFGAILLVLILVVGVLRPALQRLAVIGSKSRADSRFAGGEFADLEFNGAADDTVTLSGTDDILLPGPGDSYERQLSAIKGLVTQDPGRVAQVVKQWVNDDV
ncbi:MAG: flagellar basal-body MS-ring/collar protein FliF [Pseudomonadales bacterium]|nr:flagellar basal-body MS-ring/collar protein FliF [Pseudomonadales bacterium]